MVDLWYDLLVRMGVRDTVADNWADTFARVMSDLEWSAPDEDVPNFLAQAILESGRLTSMEEKLSYSAQRLTEVWPRRFPTLASAQPYARNPRALANKVYGGRLGNVGPDDGWRYRGRALIQITGLYNYLQVQRLTGMPVVDNPDLLFEQEPAIRASAAWWEASIPDEILADAEAVSRKVNGGSNGLAERLRLTAMARAAMDAMMGSAA